MLFPTVEFAIFFPIVLAISWALMPRQHWWKPFIVVASYVFYAAADPRFCLLLGAITLVSQLAAVAIHRTEDERLRKLVHRRSAWPSTSGSWRSSSTTGSSSATSPTRSTRSASAGRCRWSRSRCRSGVSFFSFQAVTYVVDVKRRQTEPASLLDAAIYLSFFPHLVAGPIVRAQRVPATARSSRATQTASPSAPG